MNQQGMGLIEIMVALALLAIGVLGFVALQVRAVSASIDAGKTIQASLLAQDLSERRRVNREGQSVFNAKDGYSLGQTFSATVNCAATNCTSDAMAAFDFNQVRQLAQNAGMQLAVVNCPNMTFGRKCILVSWDDTTPTVGQRAIDCITSSSTYVAGAQCIMMESY